MNAIGKLFLLNKVNFENNFLRQRLVNCITLIQFLFEFNRKIMVGQFGLMNVVDIIEKQKPLPNFWDLLSDHDKRGYKTLKSALESGSCKRNRGHRIEAFDNILEAIHRYAERRDENDWRRFLVCGVCWMDNMLAINTRQLRLLISKCKSSINGSFQKLGYSTNSSHTESWKFLFDKIPLLKDNFNELRQWTIRCRMTQIQQPIIAYHDQSMLCDHSNIQMHVTVPQFPQYSIKESRPIQLNLLIPSVMVGGSINPGTVVKAKATPTPIQLPSITAFEFSDVPLTIPPLHTHKQTPSENSTTGIDPQVPTSFCPFKYRSKIMHASI